MANAKLPDVPVVNFIEFTKSARKFEDRRIDNDVRVTQLLTAKYDEMKKSPAKLPGARFGRLALVIRPCAVV